MIVVSLAQTNKSVVANIQEVQSASNNFKEGAFMKKR